MKCMSHRVPPNECLTGYRTNHKYTVSEITSNIMNQPQVELANIHSEITSNIESTTSRTSQQPF